MLAAVNQTFDSVRSQKTSTKPEDIGSAFNQ